MLKQVKIMVLPLVLALILAVPMLAGCGGKAAGPEETGAGGFTQTQLQQIVTDSLQSVKSVSSYKFSLEMNVALEATGGTEAGKMGAKLTSSGAADNAAQELQMSLNVTVTDNSTDNQGPQSIDMYVLPDWMYMKTITGTGETWVKMSLTEQLKKLYNLDMVGQEFIPLQSPEKIEFVGYETLDGSESYVLRVSPNMQNMKTWVEQQQMTSGAVNWDQIPNLEDIFKELSYTAWIDKDTKLIKKMSMTMLMEFSAAQVGVSESQIKKMNMDADVAMTVNNYNEPVSIVLPEAAQNAMEISPGS